MKILNKTKGFGLPILAPIILSAIPVCAMAASDMLPVKITVLKSAGIEAVNGSTIDFGNIVAPTNTDAVWTLTPAVIGNGSLSQNGSDSYTYGGTNHSSGVFTVSGQEYETVYIESRVFTDFSSDKLSLDVDDSDLTNSQITFGNPGLSFVAVGGRLTVKPGATGGLNAGGDPATVVVSAHY